MDTVESDMSDAAPGKNTLIVSFLTLRKVIGLLALSFPFVLYFGAVILFDTGMQRALSNYYYTGMRDVFVGTLCVIGFFLLSYKGYERRDGLAGNIACVFALGIAFFPVAPVGLMMPLDRFNDTIHTISTAGFFAALIYFCLCLFTRTNPDGKRTKQKKQRDRVYKICGYTMAACVLLIALYLYVIGEETFLKQYSPAFWLESIAIIAFGVSWLTKGEAILRDNVAE
jgi:Ni/Fe-hydrogenase subunit HybB-like protein